MKENVRLYRRKDGGLMLMTLKDGAWSVRTEDGRFAGLSPDGCDEIRAETRGKRDEVLASLYKRLDTVLSRMKMIIEVFW